MTLYTNFHWGFTGEAQSMLVENDRVVWRKAESSELRVDGAAQTDLKGQWLMPSFVDAHCHVLPTGLDLLKVHLGDCDTHAEVIDKLRRALPEIEPGRWLQAVHYDQSRYPNGEHLTRVDLDQVSTSVPILLRHVSGHASIANTTALKAARIREDEPDFTGGTFRRGSDGKVDGVLFEHAHEKVSASAPHPTLDEMVGAIQLACEKMSMLRIGCASDMMTGRFDLPMELEAYRIASEGSSVRLRLYMQWSAVFGPRKLDPARLAELGKAMDPARCKVAGIKIFADGAIGSGTAAIYGSYVTPGSEKPTPETSGALMYSTERLGNMVRTAHDAGYQVAIHSIGDYSTDLVMGALESTGDPAKHRIEHAMILSDAQIHRLARIGCHVVMQPEFLMRFAHSYERQLGPERKSHLKRFRSVLDAGIPLSFSSDRPIVAGDPRDGISIASSRPEGYDPAEDLTRAECWAAYTQRAAAANGDVDLMGSLLPGQVADFQTFATDPLV